MSEYWLFISATLGIATTFIALTGLFLAASLHWALVDRRWTRTGATFVYTGCRTWVLRALAALRPLLRWERPPG